VEAHCDTTDADTTQADSLAQRKSPGWALAYSLGGTVLLAPIFGVGLIVGPSFGHYYANNRFQANLGIGIRTLSGGLVLVGVVGSALDAVDTVFGAGILMGSALVDVVMAPFAAHDFNEAHRVTARVEPVLEPGSEQVGLALRVRF